jgi:hypothetical protein
VFRLLKSKKNQQQSLHCRSGLVACSDTPDRTAANEWLQKLQSRARGAALRHTLAVINTSKADSRSPICLSHHGKRLPLMRNLNGVRVAAVARTPRCPAQYIPANRTLTWLYTSYQMDPQKTPKLVCNPHVISVMNDLTQCSDMTNQTSEQAYKMRVMPPVLSKMFFSRKPYSGVGFLQQVDQVGSLIGIFLLGWRYRWDRHLTRTS